ncbi:acyl-CoA dehydrogenase family protein [Streptomyces sp. NPDC007088]|uniref:acyl-CoA dehydrogenase family protein n=1 Tax=Streptomyces sp. NPDC007088 TaxID=3364773 RepID=UPI00367937DD
MTTTTTAPPDVDLAQRVAQTLPVLREHAGWGESNRRLHEETLEALSGAGVFRMRIPARYGGYETDATTLLDVVAEIARGDGSAAWTVSAWSVSAWLAGHFPDHVQDEVFTPGARVCGVLSPSATATPAGGGDYLVNGRWGFVSGAHHSQWQVVLAMAPAPDGTSQWPVMAVVPMSGLSLLDDWHTMGLRATGSVTTVAENVRVPADRVVPLVSVLRGESASQANPLSPVYRSPMIPTGCSTFTGPAVGMARVALESFMARLDRKMTYTDYPSRRDAPVTHLLVAEAAMKVEEAESHASRLAALTDAKCAAGEEWSQEERVRSRAYLGRVFHLADETASLLAAEGGGSSIRTSEPLQRVARDLRALSTHALMHSTTNAELYGRVLCGLEPNTMYV